MLRLLGNREFTESVWKLVSGMYLASLIVLWFKVRPVALKYRVYSYLIGVISFVMLMPESLPYQFFKLLIPVIFLMDEFFVSKDRFLQFLIGYILIFCSLSSTDLTGHNWADTVQFYSLPFLAILMMLFYLLKKLLGGLH